jgi:S-DNA-T family DNA segregation ATPase FtsK/SpoIIIE
VVPFRQGPREAVLITFAALALYLGLSLASYHPADPGWSYAGERSGVANHGGPVGAWLADVFLYLFGYLAYLVPVLIVALGWLLFRNSLARERPSLAAFFTRIAGLVLTLSGGSGLASLHFRTQEPLPLDAGGILGHLVREQLVNIFSPLGATIFMLTLFLTGISLLTGLSWLRLMDATGGYTLALVDGIRSAAHWVREHVIAWRARYHRQRLVTVERKRVSRRKPTRVEPTLPALPASIRVERERQVELFDKTSSKALPPLALLDAPKVARRRLSDAALDAISRQVEMKLRDFGVEVEVVAVQPGPVVTRFELQPAAGVKVSQISNLAKDLARSLSSVSVRIVEIIPGKSVVGLELPNEERELVTLSEILKSSAYDESGSPLTLALGKDISGQPVVVDLTRMPHLLVAGTTGSGKSVAINAMVLSLLYKALPSEVRLIMVDPKMLELSVYEGIPHLLAPVVTDTKEAGNALRWCVCEMDRRYRLMSALGVRNVAGYNRKVKEAIARGEPITDPLTQGEPDSTPLELEPLPLVVVIIDELADLMMVTGKKIEELIARLAQKARASGIHLVLATQRPSVDVITGLIKANIPTRIAFQVSSKVDSRTILDQSGAEQLIGYGDMLYLNPGMTTPQRVHGAFVHDHEVHKVVAQLRSSGNPDYLTEVLEGGVEGPGGERESGDLVADAEADPLYDQAVRIVTESRRASISGVQRRLKIGYNRAARMVEQMEVAGIVGPLQSNGNREVLAPPPPES